MNRESNVLLVGLSLIVCYLVYKYKEWLWAHPIVSGLLLGGSMLAILVFIFYIIIKDK